MRSLAVSLLGNVSSQSVNGRWASASEAITRCIGLAPTLLQKVPDRQYDGRSFRAPAPSRTCGCCLNGDHPMKCHHARLECGTSCGRSCGSDANGRGRQLDCAPYIGWPSGPAGNMVAPRAPTRGIAPGGAGSRSYRSPSPRPGRRLASAPLAPRGGFSHPADPQSAMFSGSTAPWVAAWPARLRGNTADEDRGPTL